MIFIMLYFKFFLVGLFAVGGGLATLPFLYEMAADTGWFTTEDISTMIAVSESTPGPLGVNMASYVGFITGGQTGDIEILLGGATATLGLISPSIIIIIIVARFLDKFKENKYVQSAFYGLRPAAAALIGAAGIGIVKIAFFGGEVGINGFFWQGGLLAAALYFAIKYFKWHPVVYIGISALAGIIFKMKL